MQEQGSIKIAKIKLGRTIQRDSLTDKSILEELDKIQCNISRIDANNPLFKEYYEKQNIPVILQGISQNWDIEKYWNLASFKYLYNCDFKIGEDDDALPITIPIDIFFEYMHNNTDENPLYIFDNQLTKISHEGKALHNYYHVHENFSEDILSLLDDQRPQFRWVLIGPKRSGSLMHIDPYQSSAWNTLIQGRKRWVLFPPEIDKKTALGMNLIKDNLVETIDCQSPISFFYKVLPKILEQPVIKNKQIINCIQYPGETIFVPRGWWHAVLNLDDTIAVTQNYINSVNFNFAWRAFRQDNPLLASKLLKKLQESQNLLYKQAIQINQEDNYKMLVDIDILQDAQDNNSSDDIEDLPNFDNNQFQQNFNYSY